MKSLSNTTINSNIYITAFIDLLGLSQELLMLESVNDTQSKIEYIKESYNTKKIIDEFRDIFQYYFWDYMNLKTSQRPDLDNEREKFNEWAETLPDNPIIHFFTDSVIISIPINENKPGAIICGLHALLLGCCLAQQKMVSIGLPLRGAISMGNSIKLNDDEIIGAGLVRAVKLESSEALYPRIIMDFQLIQVLILMLKSEHNNTTELSIIAQLWNECHDLLSRDVDGYWHVDFFNPRSFDYMRLKNNKEQLKELIQNIDDRLKPYISDNMTSDVSIDETKKVIKWFWLGSYWKKNRNKVLRLLKASKGNGSRQWAF